jgi:DNA-binding transcriptional LysR family regulator
LFDRVNRSVRLTSAGLTFLPEAKRIVTLSENAARWTRRAWQGESGVIRLGFTATAAFADLPLILERAQTALPDVKIVLKEGTSTAQKEALFAEDLDAALRPPIDWSNFDAFTARRERFVAALHRDDERSKKAKLTLSDFDGKNFIMYSADGAGYSHYMLTEMFERAQVSPVFVHHLDQNHSILSLVSTGLGAALIPASLSVLAFPTVIFREVEMSPAEPIEMCMLWRPGNRNPALTHFLALCREIFELDHS